MTAVGYEHDGSTRVSLSIGNHPIGTFAGHTRYPDVAVEVVEKALAKALGELLDGKLDPVPGDDDAE